MRTKEDLIWDGFYFLQCGGLYLFTGERPVANYLDHRVEPDNAAHCGKSALGTPQGPEHMDLPTMLSLLSLEIRRPSLLWGKQYFATYKKVTTNEGDFVSFLHLRS